MTEEEWSTGSDPYPMFAAIRRTESSRKLRLFGCACCRQVWDLLVDERSREAVRMLEDDADDESDSEISIALAHRLADAACRDHNALSDGTLEAAHTVFDVAHRSPLDFLFGNLEAATKRARGLEQAAVRRIEIAILRDIFGNPFRPVAFDPGWLTSPVLSLAQTMYDSRDFSPMPILADALQDAGCDAEAVLSHCRGDGPHVRGCWVVDAVLGKS